MLIYSVLFQTEISEVQQLLLKTKPLYLLELLAILKSISNLNFRFKMVSQHHLLVSSYFILGKHTNYTICNLIEVWRFILKFK